MHYRNGTPAKVGDIILAKSSGASPPFAAVVVDAQYGSSQTCNLLIVPFIPRDTYWATAKECLLASDAFPGDPKPNPTTP